VTNTAASPSHWAKYRRWIIGGSIGALLVTFAGKFAFNLAVNLITLWFEHSSGYLQSTQAVPDRQNASNTQTDSGHMPPGDDSKTPPQPPSPGKEKYKEQSPKEMQPRPVTPKAAKAEPPLADVTFERFAATYSSLSNRDRPPYIRSLAGKRVKWTAYINQIYLYQNVIYLTDKRGSRADVNVAVDFTDEMRLSVGPVGSKIRVSGTVEIREHWVVIIATELSVIP
jgi:hypothetical protein